MSYKLRINLLIGRGLHKGIRSRKNEYALSVYVDNVLIGSTSDSRTFLIDGGSHELRTELTNRRIEDCITESIRSEKLIFTADGDTEYSVIAESERHGEIGLSIVKPDEVREHPRQSIFTRARKRAKSRRENSSDC